MLIGSSFYYILTFPFIPNSVIFTIFLWPPLVNTFLKISSCLKGGRKASSCTIILVHLKKKHSLSLNFILILLNTSFSHVILVNFFSPLSNMSISFLRGREEKERERKKEKERLLIIVFPKYGSIKRQVN